jgi:FAD dependent oxidoreductase
MPCKYLYYLKPNPRYRFILLLLLTISRLPLYAQVERNTDVLVIGGGAGGTAAGLQCARMGVETIIAEPTTWLGGMLSAAGVPAFDGNHNMPSGIWAELREQLYKVYGGAAKVATGWVSNTLFEPHVADSILKAMTLREEKLTVLYQYRFVQVLKQGTVVKGAVFFDIAAQQLVTIHARQVIDATELGDVMADAGIPFDVGLEASSITGEKVNVPASRNIIQDMTYAAILKDYGAKADCTIARPAGYDSLEFDGCCKEFCSKPEKLASNVDAKQLLDYGKLPNGKYMINWPGKGNDIYLNLIALTQEQREKEWEKAKAKTLRFLYFLQTQLGFRNLALADDEFPTADRLPLMPYYREGRRVRGLVRFKVQHISDPFNPLAPLYRTGIAVGDYPIDHHHRENPDAPQHMGFYPIPSFNLPLGALIPEKGTGIIIAEKGTSVSNVVNGTTRLQPCVMLTGQAAGALAALCVVMQQDAAEIPVRHVQAALLESRAYIMPYYDVKPSHPHFKAIQKIGATGILKGTGQPNAWANRTWFYPDSTMATVTFLQDLNQYMPVTFVTTSKTLTIKDLFAILSTNSAALKKKTAATKLALLKKSWTAAGLENGDLSRAVKRMEIAVMTDRWLQPFETKAVNHQGFFIVSKKK